MIYEGRILNKGCIEKRFIAYKFVDILRELGYIKYIVLKKETTDLIYIKKGNDKLLFDKNDTSPLLNVYAYKECKEIPTEKAESAGLETFFRFTDIIGRELVILEILHKYMEKYSDAIFYVDNGLYFTKQDIDIIYNLKDPDAEWIYKNPDTYKK